MAALPAIAAIAGTGFSAISMYQNSKYQQDQTEADAKAAQAQGRLEAERIRKEKDKTQSAARAALAQNGLSVNDGTALVINDEIEKSANHDANIAEITGYNSSQRLNAEASQYKKNANTALAMGVIDVSGRAAKGYNDGWK